jgi:hypothetical protein
MRPAVEDLRVSLSRQHGILLLSLTDRNTGYAAQSVKEVLLETFEWRHMSVSLMQDIYVSTESEDERPRKKSAKRTSPVRKSERVRKVAKASLAEEESGEEELNTEGSGDETEEDGSGEEEEEGEG